MTTEAVIVSTARTGVGKAYRGALNNTEGPTVAGHVISEAVKRAGIAPSEVEDVVMGCAMQQGTTAMNVARKGAIRAGLPVTVAGTTIDRQCASGLQAIAVARRLCRRPVARRRYAHRSCLQRLPDGLAASRDRSEDALHRRHGIAHSKRQNHPGNRS